MSRWKAENIFTRAQKAARKGDLPLALSLYDEAKVQMPREGGIELHKGFAFLELGDYPMAESSFRQARQLGLAGYLCQSYLALSAFDQNRNDEALEILELASTEFPTSRLILGMLLLCYLKAKRWRDAALVLEEQGLPDVWRIKVRLCLVMEGQLREKEGRLTPEEFQNIEDRSLAADVGKESLEHFKNLGITAWESGRYGESLEQLLKALRKDPAQKDVHLLACLGEAYSINGGFEKASLFLERALALSSFYIDALSVKAQNLARQGFCAEALALLDKGWAENSNAGDYWYEKGSVCERMGDFASARKHFRKNLQIDDCTFPNHWHRYRETNLKPALGE